MQAPPQPQTQPQASSIDLDYEYHVLNLRRRQNWGELTQEQVDLELEVINLKKQLQQQEQEEYQLWFQTHQLMSHRQNGTMDWNEATNQINTLEHKNIQLQYKLMATRQRLAAIATTATPAKPSITIPSAPKVAQDPWDNTTIWYVLICFLLIIFPPANNTLRWLVSLGGVQLAGGGKAPDVIDGLSPEFSRSAVIGDKINGYDVSDVYGDRIHPITEKKSFHAGVDIATPIGTPVYAFSMNNQSVTVDCFNDPAGGLGAEFSPKQGTLIRFWHLDSCTPGKYKPGEKFGTTGNSGQSTGPHLHLEERIDDKPVNPQIGYVWLALTGYDAIGTSPLGRK